MACLSPQRPSARLAALLAGSGCVRRGALPRAARVLAAAGLLLPLACNNIPHRTPEGGPGDGPRPGEGLPIGETGGPPLVDFVVQGCPLRTADTCAGPVPLTVTFSAVLQGEAQKLDWDFGDGSPAGRGEVISHTFKEQGSFTVTLGVATASGTFVERKPDFVKVTAGGPGAPCTSDQSCASGSCVCQGGCPFPLSEGLCLEPCEKLACHLPRTTCIDLTVPGLVAAPPWRTHLCLPSCASDRECREGFLCRPGPSADSWVKACLPPFPRDLGQPCRTGTGELDPALCLGGLCLGLGASGYCSAPCGSKACPESARCARLGSSGTTSCLLRCTGATCSVDPGLACELPDSSDPHGFEILGPPDPAGTRYCAARRCSVDAECGAAGRCDLKAGGFCMFSP